MVLVLILRMQASQKLLAAVPSTPAIQDGCHQRLLENDALCRDYLVWAEGHMNIGQAGRWQHYLNAVIRPQPLHVDDCYVDCSEDPHSCACTPIGVVAANLPIDGNIKMYDIKVKPARGYRIDDEVLFAPVVHSLPEIL
jgi:hypothetical protein